MPYTGWPHRLGGGRAGRALAALVAFTRHRHPPPPLSSLFLREASHRDQLRGGRVPAGTCPMAGPAQRPGRRFQRGEAPSMTSPCRQCERRRGGGGEKWSLQEAPSHRIIISMLVPGSTDLRGSNSTLERRDRRSFVHASSRSVGVASWFRLWQPATFGRARHRHTDTRRGGAFGRLKDATVSLADRQGVRQPGWLIPPGARRARGTRVQPNAPSAALLTAALSESQTSWRPFLLTTTRRAGRAAAAPSGRGRLLLHYGQLGHHRRHGLHGACLWGWRGGDGACGRGVVQGGGAREERRRSPTPPATPRVCGSGGSAAAHRGGGRRGG